jgi:D-alanyl-D-alanine carboxypeptidase/Putative Flp pilus-assembly TadE/G-like
MEGNDDQGQATPLLVAAVGLVAVILLSLGPMGRTLAHRAQARTAADATALAGAAEGERAAERVAEANGADLVAYRANGDEVVVEVGIEGVTAFGRARRHEIPAPTPAASGERAGLAPAMLAALAEAGRLLGQPVPVVSGYRSAAQQRALWERRHANPYPVAPPGRSMHERGLAVDVPRAFVEDLLAVAAVAGLCQPLPTTDPVHFELCGA